MPPIIPHLPIPDRETANLRSLLEPQVPDLEMAEPVPEGLETLLSTLRPFSAATLAIMTQTNNEWLARRPVKEMANHYFATLAWLFIQGAPQKTVAAACWDQERFTAAVLEWGSKVTPDQVAACDAIIQHVLGLVDQAQTAVISKPKPEGPTDPKDTPPGNS